jgi:C-terminal processing protease CtpA/Prc
MEYRDLKSALDTLQNEIRNDATEAMKKIGFEIKKYKPEYNLDWEYNDSGSERTYKINTNDRKIRVQYGRSQYDTLYTTGFKVLGKKGNKYSVEIYRESNETRTYNILEKKFESFVEEVTRWENQLADENKIKIEERFESYQK